MMKHACILVAALALPLALHAQRGGLRPGPLPPDAGVFTPPPMPSAKDLEKEAPAAILLDKKKKLQLSDSQVTALEVQRRAGAESNAAFYATWDSVRTDMLIAGKSTLVDPDSAQARRRRFGTALQTLRMRTQAARAQALLILTDDQKPKAQEYWDDADRQNEKWMGARRGGGGGGPPGGRRPPTR